MVSTKVPAAKLDEGAQVKQGRASSKKAAGPGGTGQLPSHPHYLMKSEPEEFSFDDLEKSPGQASKWDGVRNIQAMRLMRGMQVGTQVFFYHSATKVPAIIGIAEVCKEAYPDHTAYTKGHKYFDAKSDPDAPKWYMVDVRYVRPLKREVTLSELRAHGGPGGPLENMKLLRQSRLSVGPVTQAEWDFILGLENQSAAPAPPKAARGGKAGKGRGKKEDAASDGASEDSDKDAPEAPPSAAKVVRSKARMGRSNAAGASGVEEPETDAPAPKAARGRAGMGRPKPATGSEGDGDEPARHKPDAPLAMVKASGGKVTGRGRRPSADAGIDMGSRKGEAAAKAIRGKAGKRRSKKDASSDEGSEGQKPAATKVARGKVAPGRRRQAASTRTSDGSGEESE